MSIRVLRACLAIIYAHACLDSRSHVSTALDSRRRVFSSRPARALARIDAACTRYGMGMRGVSTASIEEDFPKKLITKMWLISPRDFNHIFVIDGPPGSEWFTRRATLAGTRARAHFYPPALPRHLPPGSAVPQQD